MNGVQQIGFTHTIFAKNAHNPLRKREGAIRVIFELKNGHMVNP